MQVAVLDRLCLPLTPACSLLVELPAPLKPLVEPWRMQVTEGAAAEAAVRPDAAELLVEAP